MLIDDVRVALRVTSTMSDVEVQALIDFAIEDMRRVGIRDELLEPESMDPMARAAVIMFCKANYGFDNSEGSTYQERYKWCVLSMMNSSKSEVYAQGET